MKRFWDKVDKRGTDDCWEWMAGKNRCGYGTFVINGKGDLAHRASILIEGSDIPSGMCVLHSCDNPSCVNPSHLFIGTQCENNQDRHKKGRSVLPDNRGSKNHYAVLNENDVLTIRSLRGEKKQCEIADEFNVSQATISMIMNGTTWRHV